MKFKISVTDFQYAMRVMKDVAPSSGAHADISGVLICAEGDVAVFTAFNPEVIAKATVKIQSDVDGSRVVDAASLYSAISHFKPQKENGVGTTDILVSSSPKSKKLTISAKTRYATGNETTHKRVFALKSQEFFPQIPDVSQVEDTFDLPASAMISGIESVSYALSSDKNQLIFTGMLMELLENKISFFATNGICLARYTLPVSYTGKSVRVILPGSFTSKLAKSFFETDTLTVSITPNMIFVRTPNLVIGGALIRDEYPDYNEVLPEPKTFICLDKHMLLDNLVNMSYEAPLIDESRVSILFKEGETVITCGHSTNGGIPNDCQEEISFDSNLNLLASSIRNIFGNELKIGISSTTEPITFLPVEYSHNNSNLMCVLVPLSL